jgi:hypothetical protein
MTPADETTFIRLWNQGATYRQIAAALQCSISSVAAWAIPLIVEGQIEARSPQQQALARQAAGTPEGRQSTPASPEPWDTEAHPGTPPMTRRHTRDHPRTPAAQPTAVHQSTPTLPVPQPPTGHPSVPMPEDLAVRLLSLLPDLEVIVARERDRQRLLRTPVGTPQHTVKKTYVVDTLYVDLIERYATAEGVERKDVVNLAFHEFFERRQYLPSEG